MKKIIRKFIKNNLLSFVVSGIIFGAICVGATTLLASDNIEYKNSKSLKSSLDELYSSASQIKYNSYKVGQKITLNNELYYVISDSNSSQHYVTLLKAEPLTVAEVNTYGVGHVNRYTVSSVGTASNQNGYGEMAYYTSETCGYVNGSVKFIDCKVDYNSSEVKYAVDSWARAKFTNGELATDISGYRARLITISELESLGYEYLSGYYPNNDNIPSWVNSQYAYWTMSSYNSDKMWFVDGEEDGGIYDDVVNNHIELVRPVINVRKNKL